MKQSILAKWHRWPLLASALVLSVSTAIAQPDFTKIEVTTTPVRDGIYMLSSPVAGNVGVSTGEDGVLLIDDQLAQVSPQINAAIEALSSAEVRFLVNTHWHFDHVGDNETQAGKGAVIVAHDRVRERMKKGQFVPAFQRDFPPASKAALPVVTFEEGIALHFNGQTIELIHPAPAHTDGDAVVYFLESNVVLTGDLFWNGMYPLIDASSGGSAEGMVNGVADILDKIDESTKIVPGHGPLATKAQLQAYQGVLSTVYERIADMKGKGKSLEEVVASKPTAEFDPQWGKGLFDGDTWTAIVYSSI